MHTLPAHEPSPLVGREHELQAIDATLSELVDGDGGVLMVTGEPGIGKTRLLDALRARAAARGATLLHGRTAAAQGDLPYDVIADAFATLLATSATAGPAPAGPASRSDVDVATAVAAITGAVPRDRSGGDERFVIWRGVRRLLEQLAVRAPVVVALDDVHWADRASLDLIAYLLRRPPAGRVLLALAWRDAHDRAVTLELVEAARGSRARRLAPARLSAAQLAQLLGAQLDDGDLRAVVVESGGNPFYAEQLGRRRLRGGGRGASSSSAGGRAAGAAGATDTAGTAIAPTDGDGDVPQSVVAAVEAEVEALGESARRLARGAAITGDPFVLESAVAAAGIAAAEVGPALDALTSASLVVAADGARRFSFRHPIVRRAIHDAIPLGWQIDAHARAARALEANAAPTHLRAHHIARSAARGDLDAVATLRAAASTVLPQSPASSAEWAAAARALVEDDPAQLRARVELLELEARALMACGRLEAAHAALAAGLAAVDAGSGADDRHAGLLRQIIYLELLLGWFDRARLRLARAFEDGPGSDVMRLYLAALQLVLVDPDGALAVGTAPEPAEVADPADRNAVRSALLATAAIARQALGDIAAAQADCDGAAALLDAGDPDGSDLWPEAALLVVLAERTLDRERQAIAHLRQILGARRPMRQIHIELRATTELALMLAERGDLAEAAELAETAVETGRLVNSRWLLANALAAQVAVARLRGDVPRAVALAREAFEQPLDRTRAYPGTQRRTLGATYLAAGDASACVELFRPAGVSGAADMAPGGRVLVHELLAEAELLRGDVAAARAEATAARERGGDSPLPRTRARALRTDARV
ncbi:AAA family ATPase, partial [Conexibacter stalactiti]